MKKFIFISACLAFLTSCSGSGKDNTIIFGSSNEGKEGIINKDFNYDFDEIEVSAGINAEVIKSDVEKVVISAPADIMDKIDVVKSGNRIHIKVKPNSRISTNRVSAKVYAKDFSSIEANSSADVNIKDQFTQDKTTVKVSSSGSIKGNLEANDLSIYASSSGDYSGKVWAVNLSTESSSSGDIVISGKTKNAIMTANSSGTVDAKNTIAENAELNASSSGDVYLGVSEKLDASASSSGSIEVYKKGALTVIEKNESSSGSVVIRD